MNQPEKIQSMNQAAERGARRAEGVTVDPSGYAIARPTKEWEKIVFSLPVSRQGEDRDPIQDPATGKFVFMLGVDSLDEAPLG